MLSDSEIDQLSPAQNQVYLKANPEQRAMFARVWKATNREKVSSNTGVSSGMRSLGANGTVLTGISLAIFTFLFALEPSNVVWLLFVVITGALCGISIFMWMLGVIEQRLIMIDDALKTDLNNAANQPPDRFLE